MAAPSFSREHGARVIVDALAFGDRTTAERWKISEKTVRRYRLRMETDTELSKRVSELQAQVDADWRRERLDFLRAGLSGLQQLVEKAKSIALGSKKLAEVSSVIRTVAGAIEKVGDLQVTADALNGSPGQNSEGAQSSATAAGTGGNGRTSSSPALH